MDNGGFRCRICGNCEKYSEILNAKTPLAAQVTDQPSKDMVRYPLHVVRCCTCGHVQLKETLDINLYDDYLYTPSYASGFEKYIKRLVDAITLYAETLEMHSPKVFEIGSSNGYFLQKMKDRGWNVLGIEPSSTLVEESLARGVDTIKGYFGPDTINEIEKRVCVEGG